MAPKSYLLFTTPFCPNCPPVKAFMSRLGMEGTHVDATEEQGSQQAIQFGVRSVPTVVFLDEGKHEIGRANNVSSIRMMLSDE